MKISKASDYAVVLLANLEKDFNNQWVSVRTLGERMGLGHSYLSNIVHKLVQAGILESHRGAHGGIRMAKATGEITIGGVLAAMKDGIGLVECIEHPGQCPLETHCDVMRFWTVTHGLVLAALRNITLQEIITYLKGERPKPKLEVKLEGNA